MIKFCYEYGKKYNEGSISISDARDYVSDVTGMNSASAQMYINAVKHLLSGGIYIKTISAVAYEYIFDKILEEYGVVMFKKAINVAEEHLDYLEEKCGVSQGKSRDICNKYLASIKLNHY